MQEGLAFHNLGQFDEAILKYREVLKNNCKHFDALQLLGAAAAQQKKI
jgi:hypothetical protein